VEKVKVKKGVNHTLKHLECHSCGTQDW